MFVLGINRRQLQEEINLVLRRGTFKFTPRSLKRKNDFLKRGRVLITISFEVLRTSHRISISSEYVYFSLSALK